MKKSGKSKILSMLLAIIMVAGMLPMSAMTTLAAVSDTHEHTYGDWENKEGGGVCCTCSGCGNVIVRDKRDVMLGVSAFTDPIDTNDDSALWDYKPTSFVYFGNKQYHNFHKGPVLWQVQSAGENIIGDSGGMLLLARHGVEWLCGDNTAIMYLGNTDWRQGNMLTVCNRFEERAFSTSELNAIQRITYNEGSPVGGSFDMFEQYQNGGYYGEPRSWEPSYLYDDQVFVLSVPEFYRFVANYQYCANANTPESYDDNGCYLLRSHPVDGGYCVGVVGMHNNKGIVGCGGTWGDHIRPAMNLDKSKVMFAVSCSYTYANRFSILQPGGTMRVNPGTDRDTWSVAIHDESRDTFDVTETSLTGAPGETVRLHYTGAGRGAPGEAIYAFVTKAGSDEVLYYSNLRNMEVEPADGFATLTLPQDMPQGNYTLKVFSAKDTSVGSGRENLTRYSSAFVDIPLTVTDGEPELTPHTITVEQSEGGVCRAAKYRAFPGEEVFLYITPESGYTFVGCEIVSGEGQFGYYSNFDRHYLVMGDTDVTVRPIFEEVITENSITVISDGNGKVYAEKNSAWAGESVDIYVYANKGYTFKEWQLVDEHGNTSFFHDVGNASFIMPNKPIVLKAVFAKNYSITVNSPAGTNVGASVDAIYNGLRLELWSSNTATKVFKEWRLVSGNAVIEEPANDHTYITVGEGDVVFEAVYQNAYRVKAIFDGGWVSMQRSVERYGEDIEPGSAILPGERVYLECGSHSDILLFKEWEAIEGNVTVLENDDPEYPYCTHYFIMPAEDVVLSAITEKDTSKELYQVTVLVEGKGVAEVYEPYFEPEETVYISAYSDNDYYIFKEFQVISGGITVDENHEFIMPHNDVVIKAIFERNHEIEGYSLTVTVDGNLYAEVGNVETPDGEFITLKAYDYAGRDFFKEWQVIEGNIEFTEYKHEWAPDQFETLFGFYMPEEDVEIHAVAQPFVHYFHDWHTESINDEQHRKYCECGASVDEWHYTDYYTLKKPTHTEEGIERTYCHNCDYYYDTPIPIVPEHEFYGSYPFCEICGATKTNANKVTSDAGTSTTTVKENTCEQIVLPESIISNVSEENSLVIELKAAKVDLSKEAVATVKDKADDLDIRVEVSDDEPLTEAQKNSIPEEYRDRDMIVVNVTASVGNEELHELGGLVTLTIPYDTASVSGSQQPVVYYLPENGEAEIIENVVVGDGYISFTTDHFSTFVVAPEQLNGEDKAVVLTGAVAETETAYMYEYSFEMTSHETVSGTIFVALYDGERLVGIETIPVNENISYYETSQQLTASSKATTYKIMFWSGLDTLKPICEAANGNIIIK